FPLAQRHFTIGQLDTDHLHAGLALTVYAPGQAQAAELFLGNFSLAEQQYLFVQLYDIFFYNRIFQFCSEALHANLFMVNNLYSYSFSRLYKDREPGQHFKTFFRKKEGMGITFNYAL